MTYQRPLFQPAFTLVEMLVVLAIVGLMMGIGVNSFFGYRERQALEQTAANLQTYIRQIQNYAKNGYRGEGDCALTSNNTVTNLALKLNYWNITYNTSTGDFEATPHCTEYEYEGAFLTQRSNSDKTGDAVIFRPALPKNYTINIIPQAQPDENLITFQTVFGETLLNYDPNNIKYIPIPNLRIVIANPDDDLGYRFYITNGGIITDGCLCTGGSACANEKDLQDQC